VLPCYADASLTESRCIMPNLPVWLGKSCYPVRVHESVVRDVPFFLVECPPLFGRKGVYVGKDGDFPDNHQRFAVLCRTALAIARWIFRPAIFHCHDWQAALVPVYLRSLFAGDPTFMGIKCLLSIHNLGYQGIFAASALGELGLDKAVFHAGGLEFHGDVNLLKGGICFSDALSTVSRGYAAEIQTPEQGYGLDGLLAGRSASLTGILNGVDYSEWNPETDPHLAARYSARDLAGKLACKRDLLVEFGLPAEAVKRPLAGIVSRFASQKGFDLLAEAAPCLAAEDLTLIALGTGEPRYEKMFRGLAKSYPGQIAVKVAYDDRLAHKIEAGADIFLMPSKYEPCGLNQMYSLRYGTVPVVRATGGLDDTIDESTGFKFKEYSSSAFLEAVRSALAEYTNRARWLNLVRNGMAKDYSWTASAQEYAALYRRLTLES
jgi:starch synthase